VGGRQQFIGYLLWLEGNRMAEPGKPDYIKYRRLNEQQSAEMPP